MNYSDKAHEFHENGKNCAQSVLLTSSIDIGLDQTIADSISVGFGGGVRSGEICGAISGAIMAMGICGSSAKDIKDFVDTFKEHFGYVRCFDLKNKKYSCDELIRYSADLLQNYIEREK